MEDEIRELDQKLSKFASLIDELHRSNREAPAAKRGGEKDHGTPSRGNASGGAPASRAPEDGAVPRPQEAPGTKSAACGDADKSGDAGPADPVRVGENALPVSGADRALARSFLRALIAEVREYPDEYREISWLFELGSRYDDIREGVLAIQKEISGIGYDVRAIRGRLRREFVS